LRVVSGNRRLVCAALCVSLAASASAASKPHAKPASNPYADKIPLEDAYFGGDVVKVRSAPLEKGERALIVGPWNFGPRVSPRPNDKRPNLYFVIPGTLHEVATYPDYDHTAILSAAPDQPSDFDVYWALVLDPTVTEEFTGEKELLVATQATFVPGPDFTFDNIPCSGFLRDFLNIKTMAGLDKYRRPDGSLPRVAIVTAGLAVRLEIEKPEEQEKEAEQPLASPPPQH